jgi:antitoxin component YwqK of YwqJK toxin-antitoxin module
MNKFILLTLFFSVSILNGNEVKKEFYPSGKLKSEIYINGSDGWIKKYYDSGNLMGFLPIKKGKSHGTCIIYFNSGKKALENEFENGIENGQQKIFYISGKLRSSFKMKNGQSIGEGKEFYESGKIAAIGNYNGTNIKVKTFFETGELSSICKYNDIALIHIKAFDKYGNPLNGNFSFYYNSGKLQIQGFFVQGIPDKIYQSYYESGNLSYKGSFKNGKPEGQHEIFSENGKVFWRIPYKDGNIDGVVFSYHPITGDLIEKSTYKNGNKIKEVNAK